MSKSLRFLSWFFAQIALTILGFAAIVLVGVLLLGRDTDNLFAMYYRMFPMMVVMIVAVTMFTMQPYCNLALSMNAGRPGLFAAMQIGLIVLSVVVPLLSRLLWVLGQLLNNIEASLPLPQLALLAVCSAMLSEISLLTTTLEGKLRQAAYGVTFVLYILVCGGIGAATAVSADHAGFGSMLAGLFSPAVTAGLSVGCLAIAAAAAAGTWLRMRKAVVRV